MARILFVVPPFVAHVNPAVSVERELAARGHATAWVAHESMRPWLPPDALLFPVPDDLAADFERELRLIGRPYIVGMRAMVERVLVPLAAQMRPQVDDAIERFAPGLLVVDQEALAGAFAARKKGLRFVTSAPSAILLDEELLSFAPARSWLAEQFAKAQREAGVDVVDAPDVSPELVLVYFSRELAGAARTFPPTYRFVGPALTGRVDDTPFPWRRLRDGPRLLVTLGTILAADASPFYAKLADALDGAPVQVILSAPAGAVPREPTNFIVVPRVPMVALLPRVDAVLCHAGSTANEALAHGLPLVVAPIAQDQPIFARLACEAGAAVRISFIRATRDALRDAVEQALHDTGLRDSARRVQASFVAAGGARAAADAIEQVRI